MKSTCFSLFTIVFTCSFYGNDAQPGRNIIAGGTDTKIQEVPYLASLMFDNTKAGCGATIIHKYWLLTAAHCIDMPGSDEDYDFVVRTGTDELNGRGIRHKVDYAVVHPEFDDDTADNDIGLIKLKKPIEFNKKQQPIPIANSSDIPEEGDEMTISGFGRLGSWRSQPDTLQKGTVPVTDQEECHEAYGNDDILITDNMFCAGNGEVDSCKGDSGGPGVINDKVHGIVSIGLRCPSEIHPGVYTRVHNYYDWIVETTGVEF